MKMGVNEKEYNKNYLLKNKDYWKIYYQNNKESLKKYQKEYYKKNKEKIKKDQKKYQERNKEKFREFRSNPKWKKRVRETTKKRRRENNNFRIANLLRNAIRQAFRFYSDNRKNYPSKVYGVDYKAIIEHLKPFPEPIVEYHIDHIIPLSKFDFNNPEHVKKAFLPSNHQWLTIEENTRKGNKLIMPH